MLQLHTHLVILAPILLTTVPTVHAQPCLHPCSSAPAPDLGMLSTALDEQRDRPEEIQPQHCSPGFGDLKKQRKLQIEELTQNCSRKRGEYRGLQWGGSSSLCQQSSHLSIYCHKKQHWALVQLNFQLVPS